MRSNSGLDLLGNLGFGLDLDLTGGESHQDEKSDRLDERHDACKSYFLQELQLTNDADGYFIHGYGHPSYTFLKISIILLLFEIVKLSKRDAYKQMVSCG